MLVYNNILRKGKMKDYIIQETDILNKVASISIDNIFIGSWPYRGDNPNSSVFYQIKNGSNPIHVKEYNKIPSVGMLYVNNNFLDGENGETFLDVDKTIPYDKLIENSHEAIVTISETNKVDGCFVVFMKYKNWVNEEFAALFAALTSNPDITIEDNVSNKFDYLNNDELIGTVRKIPVFSDFEKYYLELDK